MRYIYYSIFLLFFIIENHCFCQQKPFPCQRKIISKELRELKPNRELELKLRKLIAESIKYNNGYDSFFWNVNVKKNDFVKMRGDILENALSVHITMTDELIDYNYIGFFYLDNVFFTLSGIMNNSLFKVLGKKKIKLLKIKDCGFPCDDYPQWIFIYFLKEKLLQVE